MTRALVLALLCALTLTGCGAVKETVATFKSTIGYCLLCGNRGDQWPAECHPKRDAWRATWCQ